MERIGSIAQRLVERCEREMRARNEAAGCLERPARIVADGFGVMEGTAREGLTIQGGDSADRPPHREDSAVKDRAGRIGSTLPARIEDRRSRSGVWGGELVSSALASPLCAGRAASNDNRSHQCAVLRMKSGIGPGSL